MAPPKRRRLSKVDQHVGSCIRERRILLGLSQRELAEKIGVSYRQVQRYEDGLNCVLAGQLFEIARQLDTPIESFFDSLSDVIPRPSLLRRRMLLDIARDVGKIENEKHRQALSDLTRLLAASCPPPPDGSAAIAGGSRCARVSGSGCGCSLEEQ
jgi:transcriptional regulator with XRE-family HTH domain